MEAVFTRYHGPTDQRGSKIVASCPARKMRVIVKYDDGLDTEGNHRAALCKILSRMAKLAAPATWEDPKDWVMGDTGNGYVFVYQWRQK